MFRDGYRAVEAVDKDERYCVYCVYFPRLQPYNVCCQADISILCLTREKVSFSS